MTGQFTDLHLPVFNAAQIVSELAVLNLDMHNAGLYFQLDQEDSIGFTSYANLPGNCLMILASFDFTYYHQLELCFHDVHAHTIPSDGNWPDHWQKDQLVILDASAREEVLNKLCITAADALHVFAFNIGSFSDVQYYIIAEGLSIARGTVFHYNRIAQEPLAQDERIAWWVTK